jgi:maltose alpha-D-glucosyltransferase / alpha-amylase
MSIYSSPDKSFIEVLETHLPTVLPDFLLQQRWFGGKARVIQSAQISDVVPLDSIAYLILARVHYASGPADTYAIPLIRARTEPAPPYLRIQAHNSGEAIFLKDALTDEQFLTQLLKLIAVNVSLPGIRGQIRATSTSALPALLQPDLGPMKPSVMRAEQSNSSIVYESRLVLKLFRRVAEGLNPDLEIGAFLTEKTSFRNVPPLAGYLEYWSEAGARTSLGVLQGYIPNQGDAWQFTLRALADYYGKALSWSGISRETRQEPLLSLCAETIPDEANQRIGIYLDSAALLGQRTGELHLALASAREDRDFTPEPFSNADHQAFIKSAVQLLTANFDLLRRLQERMPDHARNEAERVLKLEETALRRYQLSAGLKSSAMVTRIHGDFHLGQVLYTGSDFVIIDFEGEPARPLEERRKKRSPLQDVAGMLRSFHYAAYAPLLRQESGKNLVAEEIQVLGERAQYWQKWVSAKFMKTYLEVAGNAIFIPKKREELSLLLNAYLLDKAVYELGYELNNRPTWVRIPLDGISQLLYPSPQA